VGRRSDFGKGVRTIKTSIEIPEEVWRAAKIRAMDEKVNFQDIVTEALREFLKRPRKGGADEKKR
jgi:hypothetical protein